MKAVKIWKNYFFISQVKVFANKLKILSTIRKEFLLLIRDLGGLAMIFIMPLVLVTVMALIQDAPFRDYQDLKLQVLFVDNDHDSLSTTFQKALSHSKNLELISEVNGNGITDSGANQLVQSGAYKAAIILPQGATKSLDKKVKFAVSQLLANIGLGDEVKGLAPSDSVSINLIFDPVTKSNFKLAITNAVEKIAANAQSKLIIDNLKQQMSGMGTGNKNQPVDFKNFLPVKEQAQTAMVMPVTNSVQHNVPAWTMFALFLILFPLAGNFIKEREEGSMLRLRLIAGSDFPVIAGKYLFYFSICLLQFALMMLVGILFLPKLGLPQLSLGTNYFGVFLTAVAVALAATAFGLLVGVFFKTHHQALAFGSVAVVLLAAIGGVWVPTYVMPPLMQQISLLSPMAWGLEACNDLFLRNANTSVILPNIFKLFTFSFVLIVISFLVYKYRNRA
jgi:ABC-2 type transport system permease protein